MIDVPHIQLSIDAQDVITFQYPSSVDGQLVLRTLSPWALEKDNTIVKGWDHGREGVRRYALDKMSDGAVILGAEWVAPA